MFRVGNRAVLHPMYRARFKKKSNGAKRVIPRQPCGGNGDFSRTLRNVKNYLYPMMVLHRFPILVVRDESLKITPMPQTGRRLSLTSMIWMMIPLPLAISATIRDWD